MYTRSIRRFYDNLFTQQDRSVMTLNIRECAAQTRAVVSLPTHDPPSVSRFYFILNLFFFFIFCYVFCDEGDPRSAKRNVITALRKRNLGEFENRRVTSEGTSELQSDVSN